MVVEYIFQVLYSPLEERFKSQVRSRREVCFWLIKVYANDVFTLVNIYGPNLDYTPLSLPPVLEMNVSYEC